MLADIFFCECKSPLNLCARAGAHLPKATSSHKNARIAAGILFYCLRSSRKNTLDASA